MIFIFPPSKNKVFGLEVTHFLNGWLGLLLGCPKLGSKFRIRGYNPNTIILTIYKQVIKPIYQPFTNFQQDIQVCFFSGFFFPILRLQQKIRQLIHRKK